MCKISVIVPVYNAEKSIEKCLDSILANISDDMQIIAINDGSTDNSKQILDTYANNYKNQVICYHKENEGVAATRNFGISKANGKYIMFVDSDDTIQKDLFKQLIKYVEKDIDIIKFKLQRIDQNKNIIEKVDGQVFEKQVDGETAFDLLAFSDILLDSPCVYLLKKELFTKNNLEFKINTEHEDFGLIPKIILKAKSVVSLDIYGYNYIQSQNSITRNEDYNKTIKKFNDVIRHYDSMIDFLDKENISDKTKKNVKTYYTNAIILKLKELNDKDICENIKEIKQRKMIKNIQVHNVKQLIKKIILNINIKWYIKLK